MSIRVNSLQDCPSKVALKYIASRSVQTELSWQWEIKAGPLPCGICSLPSGWSAPVLGTSEILPRQNGNNTSPVKRIAKHVTESFLFPRGNTCTAQPLNSGIFACGWRASLVGKFAAASAECQKTKTSPQIFPPDRYPQGRASTATQNLFANQPVSPDPRKGLYYFVNRY